MSTHPSPSSPSSSSEDNSNNLTKESECQISKKETEEKELLKSNTTSKGSLKRPPPKLSRSNSKDGDSKRQLPPGALALMKGKQKQSSSSSSSSGGFNTNKKLPPGALALMGKKGGNSSLESDKITSKTTTNKKELPKGALAFINSGDKGKKQLPPGALAMMGKQKGSGLRPPPGRDQLTKQKKGGKDLRSRALMMHKKMTSMMNSRQIKEPHISYIERIESEGFALDAGLSVVDNADCLSATETKLLRNVTNEVLPLLEYEDHEVVLANISATQSDEEEMERRAIREVTSVKNLRSTIQEKITNSLETIDPDFSLEEKSQNRFPFLYEIIARSEKGPRSKNEDAYCVLEHFNELMGIDGDEYMYIGVFDGHSGERAAEYAKMALHVNICRSSVFTSDLHKAISEGFSKTDEYFLRRANDHSLDCGTTASAVFINDHSITVGNCGDAKAILCREGEELITLIDIHTPAREDEKLRVQQAGGAVVWYGTWRVNGVLAVSRSIGDRAHCEVVISDPDIKTVELNGKEDFLLIATDGLWDVMDEKEVQEFVYEAMKKGRRKVAKLLLKEVYERASKDNTTVTIVFFGEDKHPPNNEDDDDDDDSDSSEQYSESQDEHVDGSSDNNENERTPIKATIVWKREG